MNGSIAGWVQAVVELLALGLGIVYYFGEYRRDRNNRKKNVLASIRFELEQNWQYLNNPPLPPPEKHHPEYYDPTRQVFKYRDDAITAALCSDLVSEFDERLVEALLRVSQSVRFVNQQIDELMSFRFGSPETLAAATAMVEKDREQVLAKSAKRPEQIPKRFRDYLQALALRHWAIVNEGYWGRLKPAIERATQQINPVFKNVNLEELQLHVPGPDQFSFSEAPSITGQAMSWLTSASNGSISTISDDESNRERT